MRADAGRTSNLHCDRRATETYGFRRQQPGNDSITAEATNALWLGYWNTLIRWWMASTTATTTAVPLLAETMMRVILKIDVRLNTYIELYIVKCDSAQCCPTWMRHFPNNEVRKKKVEDLLENSENGGVSGYTDCAACGTGTRQTGTVVVWLRPRRPTHVLVKMQKIAMRLNVTILSIGGGKIRKLAEMADKKIETPQFRGSCST